MSPFPAVDPIPVPAPVWLLKSLHITTLSLHFVAMQMLAGGLLVALALSLLARSAESQAAARALARRLPVVMTYVINLGVPPLLFAQVLYGRALYASSVLIGAYWIAVIFLLMACYWLLYRFSAALEAGGRAWPLGLASWLLAGAIAGIYSSNMTLMLRPEAWQAMYAASAAGVHLPGGDPTLVPRWLFMFGGALLMAGLWLLYLSGRATFDAATQAYLAATGGRLAAVMAVVMLVAARWVASAQPAGVQAALAAQPLYANAAMAWTGAAAVIFLLGAVAGVKRLSAAWVGWAAAALALVLTGALTLYRDGIRDLTLLSKGFDVWQRVETTNWSVVILFLVVFVAGLGAVGWLASVVARARKTMEGVA